MTPGTGLPRPESIRAASASSSMKAVARLVGVSHSSVQGWCQGKPLGQTGRVLLKSNLGWGDVETLRPGQKPRAPSPRRGRTRNNATMSDDEKLAMVAWQEYFRGVAGLLWGNVCPSHEVAGHDERERRYTELDDMDRPLFPDSKVAW